MFNYQYTRGPSVGTPEVDVDPPLLLLANEILFAFFGSWLREVCIHDWAHVIYSEWFFSECFKIPGFIARKIGIFRGPYASECFLADWMEGPVVT